MLRHFLISREKGGMEDRVNPPMRGDVEMEGHPQDDFFHFKGTSSFHLEFLGSIHVEIGGFEPNLISHLPRSELRGNLFLHLLLGNFMSSLGIITSSGEFQKLGFQIR